MAKLNAHDAAILRLLQKNAAMSHEDIGQALGLSRSAVTKRISALYQDGYMRGTQAIVDRSLVDLSATYYILVQLESHANESLRKFEERIFATIPNVIECANIASSWDFLLKIVARNSEHFLEVQRKITSINDKDIKIKLVRSMPVLGEERRSELPIG